MRYVESEIRSAERRAGAFIVIVPRIGIPVGVGVAVATLLFTAWTHYAGRAGGPR